MGSIITGWIGIAVCVLLVLLAARVSRRPDAAANRPRFVVGILLGLTSLLIVGNFVGLARLWAERSASGTLSLSSVPAANRPTGSSAR